MKRTIQFTPAIIILLVTVALFFTACDEENAVEPINEEVSDTGELTLSVKDLATIYLPNGTTITFRSEADGVIYEESGDSDELAFLREASLLERFLILTDANVPVPQDLLLVSEDDNLKHEAIQRGTVDLIAEPLQAIQAIGSTTIKTENVWCSGSYYTNTDVNGTYYRSFYGYPWGTSAATVYSSSKNGANSCKTVNLYLVNCSNSNTLSADTWYKNVFGNYVRQDIINVDPSTTRFWSKTYTSKRYRRVFVSGFGGGNFGGYVLFNNY